MANYTLDVSTDRFDSLNSNPKAWLIVLPLTTGLQIGDILTVQEITGASIPTGRYMYGTCNLIHSGEFYIFDKTLNLYHFEPAMKFPWIDYSATTTITGFSSISSKSVQYCVIGNTCFVMFDIQGTSNANTFTFTLPIANGATSVQTYSNIRLTSLGTVQASPGEAVMNIGSSTVSLYRNSAEQLWATSSGKGARGMFFYEID